MENLKHRGIGITSKILREGTLRGRKQNLIESGGQTFQIDPDTLEVEVDGDWYPLKNSFLGQPEELALKHMRDIAKSIGLLPIHSTPEADVDEEVVLRTVIKLFAIVHEAGATSVQKAVHLITNLKKAGFSIQKDAPALVEKAEVKCNPVFVSNSLPTLEEYWEENSKQFILPTGVIPSPVLDYPVILKGVYTPKKIKPTIKTVGVATGSRKEKKGDAK